MKYRIVYLSVTALLMIVAISPATCHAFGPPDHVCSVTGNGWSHCITETWDKHGNRSYYETYMDGRTGYSWSTSWHSWEAEFERKKWTEPGPIILNPYCKNAKAAFVTAQMSATTVSAKKGKWIVNPYCTTSDSPK